MRAHRLVRVDLKRYKPQTLAQSDQGMISEKALRDGMIDERLRPLLEAL
jgi:hypothetical protein